MPSCATLHAMAPSYYEILQVGPDASQAEIAASYRKLARKLHPDLNPAPDAHAQMQRLNEAYNTLRHPQQRQRYDEALGLPPPTAHPPANGGPEGSSPKGSPRRAWLSYQKQVGDVVVLAIGEAENLAELLAEL
ncbi:MAG: J domain-containing protein, partial [Caldilinea sp.]